MTNAPGYQDHLSDIKHLKSRYGPNAVCAACGIVRVLLDDTHDDGNGICCSACIEDYPALAYMDRDQVSVWLWDNFGIKAVRNGKESQTRAAVARAWLRIQIRQGRRDPSIAHVAATTFGLSNDTKRRLVDYVRKMGEV